MNFKFACSLTMGISLAVGVIAVQSLDIYATNSQENMKAVEEGESTQIKETEKVSAEEKEIAQGQVEAAKAVKAVKAVRAFEWGKGLASQKIIDGHQLGPQRVISLPITIIQIP